MMDLNAHFMQCCIEWAKRSWLVAGAAVSSTWAFTTVVISGMAAIWVVNHWHDILFGAQW